MLRTLTLAVLATLATACGVDAQDTAGATDQAQAGLLGPMDAASLAQRSYLERPDVELCNQVTVSPLVVATLREVPALRTREVMTDLGAVAQSALREPNTEFEELRKGVVEFQVPSDFRSAELRYDEARAVWPYPVPADTHRIAVYGADLKPTDDDFESPAVTVGRFETDVNSPARGDVRLDVTTALQKTGANIGFRFELEAAGMGTQFDNVRLVLTRCRTFGRGN